MLFVPTEQLVENFLLTTFGIALEKDKECPFWDILPQKAQHYRVLILFF
jgi:hypothetical protein